MSTPFEGFDLILCTPQSPGNIGASLRAAANFGVQRVSLVSPRCEWRTGEVRELLTTSDARELFEKTRTFDGLQAAVEECSVVVGFTRRQGKGRLSLLPLNQLPARLPAQPAPGRVALVFGNERTGLTEPELQSCTELCFIPADEHAGSLNLSHAVAVVLARLYESRLAEASGTGRAEPLNRRSMAALLSHLEELLLDVGLNRGGNPQRMLRGLKGILDRARIDAREVILLRGLVSKIQVALGTRVRGRRRSEGKRGPA